MREFGREKIFGIYLRITKSANLFGSSV